MRCFSLNERVRVKSYLNHKVKWLWGRIVKVCGPRSYHVQMQGSDKVRHAHIDQLLPLSEGTPGHPDTSVDTLPEIRTSATNTAERNISQGEPNSPLTTPSISQGPKHSASAIDVGDQETKFDSAPSSSTAPLAVRRSRRTI